MTDQQETEWYWEENDWDVESVINSTEFTNQMPYNEVPDYGWDD